MVEGSEAVEKEMSISYRAAPRTSVLSPASSFYVDLEGQIAIPSLEQSVSSRTGHLDPVTQVQSTLQEPISIEHNEGGDSESLYLCGLYILDGVLVNSQGAPY